MKLTSKVLALLATSALVTAAFGDTLTLTSGTYSNGSNGGAYTASNVGTLSTASYVSGKSSFASGSFETFCLEPTEEFYSGHSYDYTISSVVYGGGSDTHETPNLPGDPLSKGTSWLYSQFASGNLAGYSYTADSAQTTSNLQLQRAIWYLEDDYSYSTPLTGNIFLLAVANQFGGGTTGLAAAQASAAAGENGVWALNLTSGSGQNIVNNQSQLYYSVTDTRKVPDQGATVALLGLTLLGVAGFRRKFAAAK